MSKMWINFHLWLLERTVVYIRDGSMGKRIPNCKFLIDCLCSRRAKSVPPSVAARALVTGRLRGSSDVIGKMVVNEDDVINIMGGMEHAGGIKLNDHKRKLKNRFEIRILL